MTPWQGGGASTNGPMTDQDKSFFAALEAVLKGGYNPNRDDHGRFASGPGGGGGKPEGLKSTNTGGPHGNLSAEEKAAYTAVREHLLHGTKLPKGKPGEPGGKPTLDQSMVGARVMNPKGKFHPPMRIKAVLHDSAGGYLSLEDDAGIWGHTAKVDSFVIVERPRPAVSKEVRLEGNQRMGKLLRDTEQKFSQHNATRVSDMVHKTRRLYELGASRDEVVAHFKDDKLKDVAAHAYDRLSGKD